VKVLIINEDYSVRFAPMSLLDVERSPELFATPRMRVGRTFAEPAPVIKRGLARAIFDRDVATEAMARAENKPANIARVLNVMWERTKLAARKTAEQMADELMKHPSIAFTGAAMDETIRQIRYHRVGLVLHRHDSFELRDLHNAPPSYMTRVFDGHPWMMGYVPEMCVGSDLMHKLEREAGVSFEVLSGIRDLWEPHSRQPLPRPAHYQSPHDRSMYRSTAEERRRMMEQQMPPVSMGDFAPPLPKRMKPF